ncbi:tripartite tricarboxylate transporter substrate-binding protein [Piscinibacter sakaiensis]|uniref:Putative exported protein n=1 Tax=Piscinibacter sakaiensis TaxID=1547922 RepID=A0A0K8NUV8_PISS1|nr:tripartite tricarboxylate transporter substrate-binding protein [Piscinibacter sakaiensis]GAP34079.1 putative exported protein [Piscinibacter sakaiensis]
MLKLHRGLAAVAAVAGLLLGAPAPAQTTPVKVITGFAPGGSVDSLARLVADQLQTTLGRTVVVENRTGAAGRLAVEQVKNAAPDGDTLLVAPQGPMTLFPHVFKSLRFDPTKDFTPITRLAVGDYALTVASTITARDAAGLRAALKAAGDKTSFASPGAGTLPHFLGITVGKELGIPLTHVPYRGSMPALLDLVAGVVPMAVTPVTEALALHKAGKLRILATSGESRSSFVEGVPTFKEFGIDIDVPLWFGLYGPAHMPPASAEKIRAAVTAGLRTPAAKDRVAVLGLVPAPTTEAELARLQARELALWGPVVQAAGFTPND